MTLFAGFCRNIKNFGTSDNKVVLDLHYVTLEFHFFAVENSVEVVENLDDSNAFLKFRKNAKLYFPNFFGLNTLSIKLFVACSNLFEQATFFAGNRSFLFILYPVSCRNTNR